MSMELKKVTISEIANHVHQLFGLRFETGGSLYNEPNGKTIVGPIVATPFYQALDGEVWLAEEGDRDALSKYCGPFPNASDYMCSFLDAELHVLENHRQYIVDNELAGRQDRAP
ncbi:hypothetical protein DFH07DRAFT_767542 [Mycena maculata]|uniref:Uncharacterized protein n=1 Tax=Mycena maculata TaxID=230809 RepID=A0AAD7NSN6_9AGAR|nr:hypothetical protein DFH07DRAFT_767542 [Mycena maculata]